MSQNIYKSLAIISAFGLGLSVPPVLAQDMPMKQDSSKMTHASGKKKQDSDKMDHGPGMMKMDSGKMKMGSGKMKPMKIASHARGQCPGRCAGPQCQLRRL